MFGNKTKQEVEKLWQTLDNLVGQVKEIAIIAKANETVINVLSTQYKNNIGRCFEKLAIQDTEILKHYNEIANLKYDVQELKNLNKKKIVKKGKK